MLVGRVAVVGSVLIIFITYLVREEPKKSSLLLKHELSIVDFDIIRAVVSFKVLDVDLVTVNDETLRKEDW